MTPLIELIIGYAAESLSEYDDAEMDIWVQSTRLNYFSTRHFKLDLRNATNVFRAKQLNIDEFEGLPFLRCMSCGGLSGYGCMPQNQNQSRHPDTALASSGSKQDE